MSKYDAKAAGFDAFKYGVEETENPYPEDSGTMAGTKPPTKRQKRMAERCEIASKAASIRRQLTRVGDTKSESAFTASRWVPGLLLHTDLRIGGAKVLLGGIQN